MAGLPRGARRVFDLLLRRRRVVEAQLDDEIHFHLLERIDALIARGLSPAAATAEASRRFGDLATVRPELLADARHREERLDMHDRLDALRADAKFALRQFCGSPAFTLGAVATLALGIGANATMFNVIDRLLLRPPAGVRAPDQLFTLRFATPRNGDGTSASSYPAFVALRDHLHGAAALSMQTYVNPLPMGRGADARMVNAVLVNGAYFRTAGTTPALGRFFVDDDTRLPSGEPVVVIGYQLWKQAFGGSPTVIGRAVTIGTEQLRIVGVAPDGFNGFDRRPIDVWVPVTKAATLLLIGPQWATASKFAWLSIFVRVAPDSRPERIAAVATRFARIANADRPKGDREVTVTLHSILPSRSGRLSPEAKVASLLGVVSVLVLLIACSNVGNLMLARAIRRRREIAVRLALGITRGRLAMQLVTEATLLAGMGAIAALIVTWVGTALMRAVLLDGFVWAGSIIDWRTILFAGGVALVVGFVTGLLPAFQLRGFDVGRVISEGRQPSGIHRTRTISALVVTQGILSVVLLVGATLFIRSLENVKSIHLGIDADHGIVASINVRGRHLQDSQIDALYAEVQRRLATVPGVASVAIAEAIPLDWSIGTGLELPGRPTDASKIKGGANLSAVTPSYFSAIGTRIIQGRPFTDGEGASGDRVAVVSERLATTAWPGQNAIGQCIRLGGDTLPCLRIVGVAEETHSSSFIEDGPGTRHVYVPLEQGRRILLSRVIVVRAASDPDRLVPRLRAAIQQVDPGAPYADIWTMRSRLDPELRPWRLGAILFAIFGAVALTLAAIGLYSVISYSVAQRRQEMGIRLALGAQTTDIVALVMRQGALLGGLGAAIGVLVADGLAPLVQPMLFGISARSLGTYAGVIATMLMVATVASLIPAWRATRVSAMLVIRSD